jgi:hypothetical protein
MFEYLDKTDWIDGDITPVHPGIYEWENADQLFNGNVVCAWNGKHWECTWSNGFQTGRLINSECPTRWRGRTDPPVDVLLGE